MDQTPPPTGPTPDNQPTPANQSVPPASPPASPAEPVQTPASASTPPAGTAQSPTPAVASPAPGSPIGPSPNQPTRPRSLDDLPEKTFGDDSGSHNNALWSGLKFFLNWIVIPLIIVFLFQALIFQAFYVSGQSMEPTFQNGDYLVISKIGITSKNFRRFFNKNASVHYQRGDVLVFRPPIATSTFFIKRLIGLPGERVVIKDGVITIYNHDHPNGFVLHESYTDQAATTQGDVDVTVDADKVYVLGDNREPNGSYDSRQWGQLPQSDITGRVVMRLLPLNRFRFIGHAHYAALLSPLLNNPASDLLKLLLRAEMHH